LGIEEKRQEKGRRRRIKWKAWWKIMTIYSREMKTTRRGVDKRKQRRMYAHGKGSSTGE
jgi:hypothetical protein